MFIGIMDYVRMMSKFHKLTAKSIIQIQLPSWAKFKAETNVLMP